MDIPFRLETSA